MPQDGPPHREAFFGVAAAGDHLDVDVQDLHRLLASDISRVGLQEPVERRPVTHARPSRR